MKVGSATTVGTSNGVPKAVNYRALVGSISGVARKIYIRSDLCYTAAYSDRTDESLRHRRELTLCSLQFGHIG